MPHSIWSGPISFGLVNIPVKLYPATKGRSISFRLLHAEDGVPVKYIKTCPVDNKALDNEESVRGYEFEKGRFVIMEEKDFEAASASVGKGQAIEIINFVDMSGLDPIYFQKSYFLGPVDSSVKAYRLLVAAMEKRRKAALARFVMREKQHVALLWVREGGFVLETLFFFDEIAEGDELLIPEAEEQLEPQELELAEDLIDRMTGAFDLAPYHDDYREKLLQIIERKIEERLAAKGDLFAPVLADRQDLLLAIKAGEKFLGHR